MSTEGAFQAWSTDRRYRYGRRVKWRGVKLECRHDHYCGHAASDPFDPFWGWSTEAARKTWLPIGWWSRLRLNQLRKRGATR